MLKDVQEVAQRWRFATIVLVLIGIIIIVALFPWFQVPQRIEQASKEAFHLIPGEAPRVPFR